MTALVVARFTKVGPILLNVSTRHGLHAGDAVGVAVLVAGLATATIVRRWRPWDPS